MACNAPLTAWRSTEKTARGKRAVTFSIHEAYTDMPLSLPCGTCTGCKLDKALQWAIRCMHEASMHDYNCFVTLTYNDENLPRHNGVATLRPADFRNFMKKLRHRRDKISFFQAGEYGQLGRPHHHALLFNCHFPDQKRWRASGKYQIYRSPELETLWPYGNTEIGSVTIQSAGYIARYTTKETQQIAGRIPEYITMSRRPAIGKTWLEKYISDIYPEDAVRTRQGQKFRPPRYYDKQLEVIDKNLLHEIQRQRTNNLTEETKYGDHRTAREAIQKAKLRLSERKI